MRTDHQLKQDVTAELAWEPSVNADHIGVTVEEGVVTLTGHVQHYWQKDVAESAVARIKGVKGLAEAIEVRHPGHTKVGDDEIAAAAIKRLESDCSIPKDTIKVKVQRGWVTLTGQVDWYFQTEAARRGVIPLLGVTGVTNDITMKARPDTSKISTDIRHAIHRWSSDENVKVTAKGGSVRLTGHVPTWNDRQRAATTAWAASGTTSVANDISVA